jgi:hypothetical protein
MLGEALITERMAAISKEDEVIRVEVLSADQAFLLAYLVRYDE